jgi:catechol 2,3-dioxygenase-like lactoylglutathione lyase family enzyme
VDWKLEVVVIPVRDIEAAKEFYLAKMGFRLDADTQPAPSMRVVHMTPPGSACSVVIGPVLIGEDDSQRAAPSLQLVVTDMEAARAELAGRGVEGLEIQVLDPRDGGTFMFFADPDGNRWAVQEIRQHVGATPE